MSNAGKAPTPTDGVVELSVGTNFDKRDEDSNSSTTGGGQEMDREKDQPDKRQEVLLGHLALIRKEVARVRESRKIFLRRHLQELRKQTQKGRENGVDPLTILPEEIWRMTLEFVKEPRDLDNCAKTCQLFQNILKDTNSERLFGKAFPLVAKHLPERSTAFYDVIKSCRLVCKQWRSHVDRFLEEADHRTHHAKYTSDNKLERYLEEEPNHLFKPLPLFHPIHYIDLPRTLEMHYRLPWQISNAVRESMRLHPGNPILGRDVHITATNENPEVQLTFSQEFTRFLNCFGKHLYRLSLSADWSFVFDSPSHYLTTVVQCLDKCPNLKSLEAFPFGLADRNEINWVDNDILESSEEEVRQLELPDHQFLESLRCGSTPMDPVGMLSEKLVGRYSGQLKSLELYCWNSQLYSTLPWPKLSHLGIHRHLTLDVRDNLMSTIAPNLKRLDISLSPDGPGLQELLELLNRFPNLEDLELNLYGSIGESEIHKVSPELAASSTSLTSVKMDLRFGRVGVNISYDFLICFPFLKVLDLQYYCLGEAIDTEEDEGTSSSSLLKIAKYLCQDPENAKDLVKFYRSNVWEMIPSLETIGILVSFGPERTICPYPPITYTRRGYDARNVKVNGGAGGMGLV